jgi:hypothetical protein
LRDVKEMSVFETKFDKKNGALFDKNEILFKDIKINTFCGAERVTRNINKAQKKKVFDRPKLLPRLSPSNSNREFPYRSISLYFPPLYDDHDS